MEIQFSEEFNNKILINFTDLERKLKDCYNISENNALSFLKFEINKINSISLANEVEY